ncbi:MAG: efflux RND transporter periplasmic adaptor subunit [Alphaproteobacteria bacterium]
MKIEALKKYISIEKILILCAILGALGGLYMVMIDRRKMPISQPIMPPSFAPYKNYIAASGIVEAEGTNISIGTFVSGIVDEVMVNQGDLVKKDTPLFSLDKRQAEADFAIKKAAVDLAKTTCDQAYSVLKSKKHLYDLVKNLMNKNAISREEIITRQDNFLIAGANLKNAQATLKNAQAELSSAKTNLDLLIVRAPCDGQVLQVNINKGEFVQAQNSTSLPPILFGNVDKSQIRVEIDENDAWKFKPNAQAIAYLRGNTQFKIPLHYSYTEPYVVPKTQLTGFPAEKVDMRVLQVVYTYDPKEFSAYLGQQLDVYIEVAE